MNTKAKEEANFPVQQVFVSYVEASRLTSLSVKSLRRWSATGEYGCPRPVRLGRLLRFRVADLEAWFKTLKPV